MKNLVYQEHAQIHVQDIRRLCKIVDVAKIQSRYWYEIYVDHGCGPSCLKEKKCGDLEHFGTCAWNNVVFVYCKGCRSMVDIILKDSLESIGGHKEHHFPECQRHRLQLDRFRRGIRGRKVIAACMSHDSSPRVFRKTQEVKY